MLSPKWTIHDEETLRKYWGLSLTQLHIQFFPHKSKDAIKRKANRMGLKAIYRPHWSEEDKNILHSVFEVKTISETQSMLDNKYSINAIRIMANKMGLKHPKRIKVNDKFFEVPNLVNSYIAGLLASDGNISLGNKRSPRICLSLHKKDFKTVSFFKEAICFEGEIRNNRNQVHMVFTSSQCAEDLKTNFNVVPRKTYVLEPPPIKDKSFIDAYIIGFIDGDGCIRLDKGKYINFSIVGRLEMLLWIKIRFDEILEAHNIVDLKHSFISNKTNTDKVKQLSFTGTKARVILQHLSAVDIPYRMERKWNKV